jgi:hypothetical protein
LAEVDATAAAGSDRGTAVAVNSRRSPEAGSEAFWLTRVLPSEPIETVAWTAPVAPGDRIVLNRSGAGQRVLEVVAVSPAGEPATRIDTGVGASGTRYVLSLRDPSAPDRGLTEWTVDASGRGITQVQDADRVL